MPPGGDIFQALARSWRYCALRSDRRGGADVHQTDHIGTDASGFGKRALTIAANAGAEEMASAHVGRQHNAQKVRRTEGLYRL